MKGHFKLQIFLQGAKKNKVAKAEAIQCHLHRLIKDKIKTFRDWILVLGIETTLRNLTISYLSAFVGSQKRTVLFLHSVLLYVYLKDEKFQIVHYLHRG